MDETASFTTRTLTVVQKESPGISIIVPISDLADRYITDSKINADFWESVSKFRARTRLKFEKLYERMFENLKLSAKEIDHDLLVLAFLTSVLGNNNLYVSHQELISHDLFPSHLILNSQTFSHTVSQTSTASEL